MAITGVLRPGFVQLRVLDMGEAINHYSRILGLDLVSQEDDGRVYFKAGPEFDRHSLVLREADQPGMDVMGFKVADATTLQELNQKLRAYGVPTTDVPAGEQPGVGPRVRFKAPTGHMFDLYADMEISLKGPETDNPNLWVMEPHGVKPIRFDHCLLYGADIDATEKIFTDVLGFRRAEYVHANDEVKTTIALFLTCSTKAHDIAFVRNEEDGKFHHASFRVEDWNAIGNAADRFARYDVSVDIGPTRHGITQGKTIYFWDPSGNRNEVFAGGYDCYPDTPVRRWTEDQTGKGIFYYEKELNDTFLSVYT
ncbi:MAG: catechol 1,2-dioxygenase [Hyphomonas sp. BRH_c22]|uniref:catechol 2,3-dioxygenase n=1 Tax=Hyphomonas sp. BRH_c22 TaxID=1629710 RepID=UPI0005F10D45|nr:catechol 2,3-dioxygenase [Hyphomonas sp. BRH_c22]KJS36311.1 MAG: catechol 1,2-dioxygenase [Hyphomonas sp. BRH_c22]